MQAVSPLQASDFYEVKDVNQEIKACKEDNIKLMEKLMEQEKEIMRLNQVIIDQGTDMHNMLVSIQLRQNQADRKIDTAQKTANTAMLSSALSITCAVIGGTCGFTGLYKMLVRIFVSAPIEGTAVAAAITAKETL